LNKYIKNFGEISFVDYGCGKGRVMLVAMEIGFKQVIGLELSPLLVNQCLENLDKYCRRNSCQSKFLVLEQNAATYLPPSDACVFYLFNPFSPVIFEQVMKQIAISIGKNPRQVYILMFQSGFNFQSTGFRLIDQTTGVSIFTNMPC
jgi:SAM-dependent methyltransferase